MKGEENMADLVYNQAKFTENVNQLESVIKKLEGHLESFNQFYEVIRRNWSGTEFNKADVKLGEVRKTLETALEDNRKQKRYLEQKNNEFSEQVSGL